MLSDDREALLVELELMIVETGAELARPRGGADAPQPAFPPERLRLVLAALRSRDRYRAIRRTMTETTHAPVTARLSGIAAPALVVMGEADPDWKDPAAEAAWIRDRIGAEVLMVPDAGHYPHEQRPDVVNPAVLAFAERVSRG